MHVIDELNNMSVTRTTKGTLPNVPFVRIKNAILGKKYTLSLVFPNRAVAKQLHKQWKKKNTPANILSFPLDTHEGEIFISLEMARREAKKYQHLYIEHLTYLFIHGCAHLAGHTHGHDMEKFEEIYRKNFMTRNN
jgi:probable rRNA maturation factor